MKQDPRCPLGLKCFPGQICPLAVERLRALEQIDGNASHVQEEKLPGCSFAINDKDSNYCFFRYMYENEGKDHPTIEIAEKLLITQAAVYSGLNRAIVKIKESDLVKEAKKK